MEVDKVMGEKFITFINEAICYLFFSSIYQSQHLVIFKYLCLHQ